MKRLSVIISRILDPIVMVPLLLLYSVWNAALQGDRILFLIFTFWVDVVLPGFVLAYFIQKKKVLSGWDIKKRSERVPLFIFVVMTHGIVVLLARYFEIYPLFYYLATFWILTLMYAGFTLFWKISVHVGVITSLAMFMTLTHGLQFSILFVLVPIIIWARVYGNYHKLNQAIGGAIVPSLVIPSCFYIFNLL